MKIHLSRLSLGMLLATVVATSPSLLRAQPTTFVYVNDNNSSFGLNSATGYQAVGGGLSIIAGSPFGTTSTGLGTFLAPGQEMGISYCVPHPACLFVFHPARNIGFPQRRRRRVSN